MCQIIISVTSENPCRFENVTEAKNVELQGFIEVFTPPQTPPEGAKSLKFIDSHNQKQFHTPTLKKQFHSIETLKNI